MKEIEENIAELFQATYDQLFRYIARLTGDVEQTKDIIQETFLKLYLLLVQGKSVENQPGWLLRAGRNLAIDYLRKQRAEFIDEWPAECIVISPLNQEEDLLERERNRAVQLTLATLPPRERACLKLRARGLSYKEIAQVLGISVNSVGPTLAHGLRKLRTGYAEKEI